MRKTVLKTRYHLLDELRGFMVLCMVVYHGFLAVDMALPQGSKIALMLFDFFTPVEPLFAGGFIMLSGLCCNFSRSNLKRGAILLVIALGFNVVTYFGEVLFDFYGLFIRFGILNLLSLSMIFIGVFEKLLSKVNSYLGLCVSALVFILTYVFIAKPDYSFITVNTDYLFMFGFLKENFRSADFFPLIPWLFLYISGYYLGKTGVIEKFKNIFSKKCIIPFRFLGKYAIIVYILHQPIIFGATYLIGSVING